MPNNKKNLAVGIVATPPSPPTSGTSLILQSGHGARFPSAPFYVTAHPHGVLPDPDNSEIMQVTAVSGDTLTVVRAQRDTTAKSIDTNWVIENAIFTEDIIDGLTGEVTGSGSGLITTTITPQNSAFWAGKVNDRTGTGAWVFANNPTLSNVTLSGFSQGSVLFAGAGGLILQNNSQLFWDNVNGRLSIGTTGPGQKLVVRDNVAGFAGIIVQNLHGAAANTEAEVSYVLELGTGSSMVGGVQLTAGKEGDFQTAATQNSFLKISTLLGGSYNERIRITSTGNVGIGTTNPVEKLVIDAPNGVDKFIRFDQSGTFKGLVGVIGVANNGVNPGNPGDIAIRSDQDILFGTLGILRLIVKDNGNVGIGTSSPVHTLHVTRTASTTTRTARFDMTGGTLGTEYIVAQFDVEGYGGQSPAFAISSNNTIGLKLTHSDGFTLGIIDQNYSFAGGLAFAVRGSEKMRIDYTGNVGIGTTTPGAKLDIFTGNPGISLSFVNGVAVQGSTHTYLSFNTPTDLQQGISFNVAGVNKGGVTWEAGTRGDKIVINSVTGIIDFAKSGSSQVLIDNAGNVGIGTTAPENLLHVHAAVGTPAIRFSGAGVGTITWTINGQIPGVSNSGLAIRDETSNEARFIIDGSGNVGIGTTNPVAQLDVAGTRGAPATSGTIQNGILRIEPKESVGGLNVLDIGIDSASPFGAWIQSTNKSNLAQNFPLCLNPNGGAVSIGTLSPNISDGAGLHVAGKIIRIGTSKTPASATDTGNTGEICWDANYVYVCVAANTWKRAALSSW
jgi:hypothetical protein